MTDKEKVFAILTNLDKNAIKFTSEGSIKIWYTLKGNYLEFFVEDTGIGIPVNRQKAIFDRFVRADIADSRAFQGAGLGLSISKAYVEMLGGKIWVKSEEENGAAFYFTLPYTTALELKTEEDISAASAMDLSKKLKVLIVEDDEISKMLAEIEVSSLSNTILETSSGKEAVEICRNNPDIDLILLDIQIPGIDGYEATRQIREFNKDVLIIAQTAFALSGDLEKALAAGFNEYVSKPLNIGLIKKLIQKYFKK